MKPNAESSIPLAVVTGATGGIGSATCHALAGAGFAILAHYGTREARATELQAEIRSRGGQCHLVAADLKTAEGLPRVPDAVSALIEENPKYQLSVLVNNAAKLLSPSFFDSRPEDFDEYFAINTKAPFFLSQELARKMSSGGSIVNISSASAHFSSPGDITYAMSKAAVESLTKNMAEAVASRGIRVNAVIPGFTNNGHPLFQNGAARDYMSGFSILGGVSEAETIAEAIVFLATNASKRTTGALLDVTGGSILGSRGARSHSVRDLL